MNSKLLHCSALVLFRNTPIVETTDSECQTDDKQHKKIVQSNNKLKAIVQTIKDKINVIVAEKPDLFDGISEDTSDRFDHLISTIESQYEQINNLQEERKQLNFKKRKMILIGHSSNMKISCKLLSKKKI